MSLTGRVALITGASRGIGAAIATLLSSRGASVVINYSRSSAPADALVAKLGPERTHAIKADASQPAECQRLVSEVVARFGRLDVLVLNAGVLPNKDLASTTTEDFDGAFSVNVKGPYFTAQAAAQQLSAGGRIVFFSTTLAVASTVMPNYLLYLATKGAIEQMTRVLAKDLGRKEITVNCVSPGPTGTDMFFEGKSEALIKTMAAWAPPNRIGKPEEIAEVVAFLASPESAWVNGQNIRVNGGLA